MLSNCARFARSLRISVSERIFNLSSIFFSDSLPLMEKARESPRSEHVDTVTSLFGGRSVVITVRPRTRAIHCPYICVCRFLLINFKTLRIFFRAGARGPERGAEGVKIGDGRRVGCHRRGLLNRLVRGRTEPPICTCTRVINGLRTDFKS